MKKIFPLFCLIFFIVSCSRQTVPSNYKREFIHGDARFSKAVAVTSGNLKTIYIAGLTGDGSSLESQTRSTFNNIKAELETCGATFKDIVKMNTYIVNLNQPLVDTFRTIRKEILGDKDMPASTIIGVPALAAKDKMIEIEAIAVIEVKPKKSL